MDSEVRISKILADNKNLKNCESFLIPEQYDINKLSFRAEVDTSKGQYDFINNPVNAEVGDILRTPSLLNDYFLSRSYDIGATVSVVNNNSDTIFMTAAAQNLMPEIYGEKSFPDKPIFISQPVIRTQFLDSICEGSSINFINSATIGFNTTPEAHVGMINDWLSLFKEFGMDDKLITYKIKNSSQKWGEKQIQMNGEKIFIIYNGLEVGDATYYENISRNDGSAFSMSDIGFGLERIRWVLSGGSYFDIQVEDENSKLNNLEKTMCSSLALLSMSGLKPSNKSSGYRFRLFSKLLTESQGCCSEEAIECIDGHLKYWSDWIHNPCDRKTSLENIKKENERNFNRLLLDTLKSTGCSDGQNIDINLPSNIFFERVKTATSTNHINNVLKLIDERHINKHEL